MTKQEEIQRDTIPVRRGEGLDLASLERYLRHMLDISHDSAICSYGSL